MRVDQQETTSLAQLNSLSVEARWRACETLFQVGSHESVDPLIAVLQSDRDSYARALAARALGNILADTRAVDPLIVALSDPNVRVRSEAIVALGSLSSAFPEIGCRIVAPLILHLTDPGDYSVRLHVATVLGQLEDTAAVEPLIARLSDWRDHCEVRAQAAQALAGIGDSRAIEVLRTVLADERLQALSHERRLKIQRAVTAALASLGEA